MACHNGLILWFMSLLPESVLCFVKLGFLFFLLDLSKVLSDSMEECQLQPVEQYKTLKGLMEQGNMVTTNTV